MTEPSTLWELLSRAAQNYPEKGIVVHDDANGPAKKLTYSQLYREAMSKGNILLSDGIISGDNIVVLYFESHSENIIWSWAVIAAGGIPAILSPLSSETTTLQGQLQNVCEIFQGPDVVTTSILAPNFQKIPGFRVHSTRQLEQSRVRQNGALQKESRVSNKNPDDLALLLFTSGSTGHAKAVEFTHSQLLCSIRAKIIFHKHSAETRFFNWISFDHSANFCEMHLVSMYVGSDQYHAATSDLVNEPASFFTIVGTQKIGYAFAPSFFLALAAKAFLSQKPVPFLDFSNLAGLMCGGEANKTVNIQTADSILTKYGAKPNTIKIAYGLSETCSAAFYNTSAPEYDLKQGNPFASVGTHMPDCIQIRLVDTDETEVSPNTPGAIQLRGEIVFQRYYNNAEATSGCKTKDGWFNTGDLGIVDDAGNLSIVGRSKEVIIINGNNYSSFELEHCIESDQVQGVIPTYTASFGVFDEKSNTEGIVILFVPNKTVDTPERLRDTLLGIEKSVIRFCRKAPLDVLPLKVELLPKSTLGKLSRAKLKQRYESGGFDEYRISFHNQQLNGTYNTTPKATNGVNGVNGHSNGTNGHTKNRNRTNESKDHARLPTEMQKTIAGIISEETEVPLSSLKFDSAISQLGIDSLGYMRIKKCLETAFKMEDVIPMSVLLQGTSIKELEDKLLSIGTVPPVYEPIVPLSTSGSKMPLFLLHPGSGEVLCWLTILKYLPDRPIYAVRAKGLHKDDGWFEDLDEMVSCYINGIREYQPHGPYALLGFCLGGTIAFEIAKRFEADGEVVSFLAGIDNPPDLRNLRVLEDFRKILNDVLPQLGVITEEQMKEFNDEHDEKTHFEDLYRALVAKFGEQILVPFDLTLPGLIQRARVDWSMRAIFRDYIPDGSVSKIDIFWVPPMEALNCTEDEWRNKFIGEWERFSKSKPNYFKCIGNHLNIMQGEENVQCFQKALNEALVLRGV